MRKIDVDDQVYGVLETMAKPFVDSPNSVLRRILNLDKIGGETPFKSSRVVSARESNIEDPEVRSKQFVEKVLAREFGRDFNRRGRFVYMLENKSHLVYFQNFNKSLENAWYRIEMAPRRELEESRKKTFVCLTVPVEGEYYLIAYDDIKARVKQCGWDRRNLEINVDRVRRYWRELKWDISSYKRKLDRTNSSDLKEMMK